MKSGVALKLSQRLANRPFPIYLVPLLQKESSNKIFHMRINLISVKIYL